MNSAVPAIYTPTFAPARLGVGARLGAAAIALGCAVVLCIAAWLEPSPDGVGTHTELHLSQCEFLNRTGIPCPSCGMTTSFSHFAHGNLLASFYVQPMGAVLALLTAATFWIASYMALTGKRALRLLRPLPPGYYFLPLMFFAIAAWGWKIFIHLKGIDGWK